MICAYMLICTTYVFRAKGHLLQENLALRYISTSQYAIRGVSLRRWLQPVMLASGEIEQKNVTGQRFMGCCNLRHANA